MSVAPSVSKPGRQTPRPERPSRRLLEWATRPVDAASLAAFRILFGAIMCWGALRYFQNDWIARFYSNQSFFFKYTGFEWVEAWPGWGMHLHVALLSLSAFCVAVGFCYRLSAFVMFVAFAYLELIDVTNYLNHHYLAGLLSLLLIFLPANRLWSIDAWWMRRRHRKMPSATVPAVAVYVLRFQLAVVYFYAGLAKFGSDWLLHGQPLDVWLTPLTDRPLIGPLLGHELAPLTLSWCGFLYDLTIWAFLLGRRTRPFAYAVVVVFHSLTRVFFDIGLFPYIMTTATLVFFSPSWPRRFISIALGTPAPSLAPHETGPTSPRGWVIWTAPRRAAAGALAIYMALQVLVPLRHLAYPSDVLWAEHGMRFSWRVMVREKSASITYEVTDQVTGKRQLVSPSKYLTSRQVREMGGQPDLILQLAHHIGRDYRARFGHPVEVRADTWISFNGRPPERFLDPTIDLLHVPDSVAYFDYVLARPSTSPARLAARDKH